MGNKILRINIVKTKSIENSPPSILTILAVPKPKTSGKNTPTTPQIIAPKKIRSVGAILNLGKVCANHRMLSINIIALIANIGLQINDAGRIFASSGDIMVVSKAEDFLKIFSVTALAVKLAIAIGANARIEKCRRMAS